MSQLAPRDLPTLERVIEGGLRTFVDVGQALLEIRDGRLYREQEYATFEAYCQQRWGLKRQRAYELMGAASAVISMSEISDTVPAKESHAAELSRLPTADERVEAWAAVVEEHGADATAADVRAAVDERQGVQHPSPSPRSAPFTATPSVNDLPADDSQDEPEEEQDPRRVTPRASPGPFTLPPEPEASPEEKAYDALQRQRLLTRFDPVALANVVPSPSDALPGFEAYTDWLARFTEALSERARNPLRLAK
jgi:hypothetical protein